jgi:cellobiose phosphorylase
MPVVLPFSHRPGREKVPEETEYRSDDALWLFSAMPAYVNETGDLKFYLKVLPYADRGVGTVLAHLKRAIEFSLDHRGSHGLPCGRIPGSWRGLTVERRFRGRLLRVKVENPDGVQKGVRQVELNGEVIEGDLIPAARMKDENQVVVTMG